MEHNTYQYQKLSIRHTLPTMKYSFLDFPTEVRYLIYHHLFQNAEITVEQERHQPAPQPITHLYRNETFNPEILQTNKQIHAETFPLLSSSTTLFLQPDLTSPNDAITPIPRRWLANIRTIHNSARVRSRVIHVLRQQHLDLSPFANLATYRVAHLVYPDWRDSCVRPDQIESFITERLEAEFFFSAGTLKLFSRLRTYELTVTIWLLRAFVDVSVGWEIEFDLDMWSIKTRRRMRFWRKKNHLTSLLEDPKCRDFRNYDVEPISD